MLAPMTTMFDRLLPTEVVVVEAESGSLWETGLLPEEVPFVKGAVAKRVREFTAGRNCAREAMRRLGLSPGPIGVGPHREPLFPAGLMGSITHTADYCAAAVTSRHDWIGIGIDAEANASLSPDVARSICGPNELKQLQDHLCPLHCPPEVVAFGLKEAFFKAVFPSCRRYLDFADARVEPASDGALRIIPVEASLGDLLRPLEVSVSFAFDTRRVYSAVLIARRN